MKNINAYLFITFIFWVSCNTTEPTDNNNGNTSRDYTWTIDTIYSGGFQTYLTSIWGNSSNNVWICGHDANNFLIYHFDGNSWKPRNDFPIKNFLHSYSQVTGIGSDFVIFAGGAVYLNNNPPPNFLDSSLIVTLINNSWSINTFGNSYHLYSLCVVSKNNIWAGDRKGSLIHFDGSNVTKINLGSEDLFINEIEALNANEIYCNAHYEKMISSGEFYIADYLFQYNGVNWALVDSNVISPNFNRNSFPTLLKNLNGVLYGSGDNGIVKKVGNTWEIVKVDIHGQFNGTNENNIFLAHQDFGVMHYNGKDWYKFSELPHLSYYGVIVFDDTVFLLASDVNKSFVVRGIKI